MKTEWIATVMYCSSGIVFDTRSFLTAKSFLAKDLLIVTLMSDLY